MIIFILPDNQTAEIFSYRNQSSLYNSCSEHRLHILHDTREYQRNQKYTKYCAQWLNFAHRADWELSCGRTRCRRFWCSWEWWSSWFWVPSKSEAWVSCSSGARRAADWSFSSQLYIVLFYWANFSDFKMQQPWYGPDDQTHHLECFLWKLLQLASSVRSESGHGAEMPLDAYFKKSKNVSVN